MAARGRIVVILVAAALVAGELPSCEMDTAEHCLGESADLSSEGIEACLSALGDEGRSELCNAYLKLMAGCGADYGRGGVCEDGHMNGETAACLIQRVAPEKLSEACRAALPAVEEVRTPFARDGAASPRGLGPRGKGALVRARRWHGMSRSILPILPPMPPHRAPHPPGTPTSSASAQLPHAHTPPRFPWTPSHPRYRSA